MKNLSIISVILLLGIAAIAGFMLYRQNVDSAGGLDRIGESVTAIDEKQSAMLAQLERNNERISQLEGELQTLREQRDEDAGNEREQSAMISQLQENKERISQLQGELQALREQGDEAASGVKELQSTCTALIEELKKEIGREEVSISESGREISVAFVDSILFDFGSASITPQGQRILDRVGKILSDSEAERISIAGHTDPVPIKPEYQNLFPSNWELSAARAAAVARYFQNQIGIDPERMQVVGHAFNDPIANNETSEGRAKNRRVEIILTPDVA